MKKIIVVVLLLVALASPASSYAQSLEDEYRSYLIQLIELLQARIAELIALQEDMKKTIKEVKEAPAVGGSDTPRPEVVKPSIETSLGEVLSERDELDRVSFSWSAKTSGEKMMVKLWRPDGGYVIDGGLNKETDQTFEIRKEYTGVFKWTITAEKDGVLTTESGEFEVK